jgi:hypothetical protein
LLLRALLGAGTPRGFQDRGGRAFAALLYLIHVVRGLLAVKVVSWCSIPASRHFELRIFAVSVCRDRNRDLYHGLLSADARLNSI